MVSVQFKTEMPEGHQIQTEHQYKYNATSSQYPDTYILPSGNKFQFLREDINEELSEITNQVLRNLKFARRLICINIGLYTRI